MINKPPHYEVDEQNPFKDDPLNRETSAVNLTRLIEGSDTPMVMTVSAPWGQGKTTFIKMWRAYLKNQGFTSIYFDAWENDYADDPLISFIGALEELVDRADDNQTAVKAAYEKVKSGIAKVVKASPKVALNWALRGGLHYVTDGDPDSKDEIEAVSNLAATMMVQELNKQKSVRKQIEDFKTSLASFAQEVSTDGKPLIVFLDELDRCRPDYTIELLERIKHLFSVEGVFFVLSVDRDRLGHAAASQIGFSSAEGGADADGYLRRFIDLDFHLPEPEGTKYIKYCANKLGFSPYYTGVFSSLWPAYGGIAIHLNLSLRIQQQVMSRLKIVTSSFPDMPESVAQALALYLFVGAYDRNLVLKALKRPYLGIQQVGEMLWGHKAELKDEATEKHYAERLTDLHERVFGKQAPERKRTGEWGGGIQAIQQRCDFIWRMMEFSEQFRS